jgi:hypothetical protein
MKRYTYEISRRPTEVGGGWRLRLLDDGQEVGGGVFPPIVGLRSDLALTAARDDAEDEAIAWLASRPPSPDPVADDV